MPTKKELILEVKKMYPYYTKINLLNKNILSYLINKQCKNNIPILNERNSCYIDSLLVALFNNNNLYIKDVFLNSKLKDTDPELMKLGEEIRSELISIYNIIQNINKNKKQNYCKNLRKMLNDYNKRKHPLERINWTSEQLEPFDILVKLNEIFNIDEKMSLEINSKKYCTNSKKKILLKKDLIEVEDDTIKNDYTIIIPPGKLLSYKDKDFFIKDIFPINTDETNFDIFNLWKPFGAFTDGFARKIEKTTYLSGLFAFFHINRNLVKSDGSKIKVYNKIIPSLKLKMKKNKLNLYLRSMIIHHGEYSGGHYTSLYECKGEWYEYNDLASTVQLIGDFNDVCKYNKSFYLKNCTNLIYY